MIGHRKGQLYVFEGPDGVGKSTLSRRLFARLRDRGVECDYVTLPGKSPGTLGELVYRIHHDATAVGIRSPDPTSLQTLHVAAHLDTLRRVILPALKDGRSVIVDRWWWSTEVYGNVAGVDEPSLRALIEVERIAWQDVGATVVFLIRRAQPLRREPLAEWARIAAGYDEIAKRERSRAHVCVVENEAAIEDAGRRIDEALSAASSSAAQLSLWESSAGPRRAPVVFSSLSPAKPTAVYKTYWRFAAERQRVFFRRLREARPPWTDDPILREYKFTNAYRASDRVSQHLIREVIYRGEQSPEEIFFRVVVFKIFNKIETWNVLERGLERVSYAEYAFARYDKILTKALNAGETIFSGAYIMPSGHRSFPATRKHRAFLKLLEWLMKERVVWRLMDVSRMRDGFDLLRAYPMLGDFLAYQLVTDLNYGDLLQWSESEFVVPGPGARDGIRKCFSSLGGLNEAEIIRVVADRQEREFGRLGLDFKTLWGRRLQLIDCQNLFCEVDKYSRVKHPGVRGRSGRTRIKQRFQANGAPISYWYPPKWGINAQVEETMKEVGR